jgi:site-specific DNA recombinase
MLRDRYYIGDVKYKSQWHRGRHERLITKDLFERVQRVLDSHSGTGVRSRKFNHFLKGVFFCARCSNRFIISRAKGNGGVYFYYYCHGTKLGQCDQPYAPIEDLEKELLHYYQRVTLTDSFRQAVTRYVDETLSDEQATNRQLVVRITRRTAELEAQEDRYLDLLGDPDWPQDKLKAKMAAVREERAKLTTQQAELASTLEVGRQVLAQALDLLANPQEVYRQVEEAGKRMMTLTIFGKLLVDEADHRPRAERALQCPCPRPTAPEGTDNPGSAPTAVVAAP